MLNLYKSIQRDDLEKWISKHPKHTPDNQATLTEDGKADTILWYHGKNYIALIGDEDKMPPVEKFTPLRVVASATVHYVDEASAIRIMRQRSGMDVAPRDLWYTFEDGAVRVIIADNTAQLACYSSNPEHIKHMYSVAILLGRSVHL